MGSPAYYSEADCESSGEDASSVDTPGTDYSSSSDEQGDASSDDSSENNQPPSHKTAWTPEEEGDPSQTPLPPPSNNSIGAAPPGDRGTVARSGGSLHRGQGYPQSEIGTRVGTGTVSGIRTGAGTWLHFCCRCSKIRLASLSVLLVPSLIPSAFGSVAGFGVSVCLLLRALHSLKAPRRRRRRQSPRTAVEI